MVLESFFINDMLQCLCCMNAMIAWDIRFRKSKKGTQKRMNEEWQRVRERERENRALNWIWLMFVMQNSHTWRKWLANGKRLKWFVTYIYRSKLHTIHNNLRIILIGISIVRKLEAHKQKLNSWCAVRIHLLCLPLCSIKIHYNQIKSSWSICIWIELRIWHKFQIRFLLRLLHHSQIPSSISIS